MTTPSSILRYCVRRAGWAAVIVFVAASAAFVLARLAPGDFASELIPEGASAETVRQERSRLGLDRGIAESYAIWLRGACTLDLGRSFAFGVPVGPLVAGRAANTALVAISALALASAIGLPIGTLVAGRRGAAVAVVRALSVVALSLPPLVLSLVLAWLAARTGWFPTGGMTSPSTVAAAWTAPWARDVAAHLLVPTLALAIPLAATLERLQSRSLAAALDEPSLVAARARGASILRVRTLHATRLAAAPVVSVLGLLTGQLLSGSFAVEAVTAWPGLGRLVYEALRARDVPLVAGCAAAAAALVAAATLASDLVMFWLDPRTRIGA